MDMKEEEHWKQFENTGRIQDYLSFVSSTRQTGQEAAIPQETVKRKAEGRETAILQRAGKKQQDKNEQDKNEQDRKRKQACRDIYG